MFGLREWKGREDKMNKGKGKNVAQVIGFLSNLAHFMFSYAIQTMEKT